MSRIAFGMSLKSPTRVHDMLRGRSLPADKGQAVLLLEALGGDGDEIGRGVVLYHRALAAAEPRTSSGPPAPLVSVDRLINLPCLPATAFLGRDELFADLGSHLEQPVTVAVFGLGGVGKTEIALQYAHRALGRHRIVWWLPAHDTALLENGLSRLAYALDPVLAVQSLPPAITADRAVRWLESNTGWLLVLDNVENQETIDPLLARVSGRGRIIVTTRRELSGRHGMRLLPVGVLSARASAALLETLLDNTGPDGLEELASTLGHLPLGLVQAAAYIRQTRTSVRHYLRLFDQAPLSLLRYEGLDVPIAVSKVWALTFERVELLSPTAVAALRMIACYEPEDIPRYIVVPTADEAAVDEALALLASYSMITLTEQTVSIHRLVQLLVAAQHELDFGDAAKRLITALSCDTVDPTPGEWMRWSALIPHVRRVALHQPLVRFSTPLAMLLWRCQKFIDRSAPPGGEAATEVLAQTLPALVDAVVRNRPGPARGSSPAASDLLEAATYLRTLLRHATEIAHEWEKDRPVHGRTYSVLSAIHVEDADIAVDIARVTGSVGQNDPWPVNVTRETLLGFGADALLYAFHRSYFVHERIRGKGHPDLQLHMNIAYELSPKLGWSFTADTGQTIF
ncbi:hypothetical protein [Actinoplanes cyaneus]|uniref:hypothetical protein n=1 Tax=Actinoplanes cyaneus TaxID=52696 RepID=UPI001942F958|nr:hypothetical protein [Actinoplanes cyaneus]